MKMCMKPLDFFTFDLCEDRDYSKSLSFLMKSIRRFGFIEPVIALPNGSVVHGQGRCLAAKEIRYDEEIPCVIVDDWDEEDAREFGYIANKIGTKSKYNPETITKAMADHQMLKHYGYQTPKKKTDTEKNKFKAFDGIVTKRAHHKSGDFFYISFLKTTKKVDLGTIKKQAAFYDYIIEKMVEHISMTIKAKEGYCIIYAPKRRTLKGNIAELVAMKVGEKTNIKVYEDAIVCHNRDRIHPDFELTKEIPEENIILIDDIFTTGSTVQRCVELLENKNIQVLIGLCNKYS